MRRRSLISASCLFGLGSISYPALASAEETATAEKLLLGGAGGLVVAMRHAQAPGTFDPPGFRAGVCSTQRNLSDQGRVQARRIGDWYRAHGLAPTAVRSSAHCRCLDTGRLAFGAVQPWAPLDSFIGDRAREAGQTAALRAELARRAQAQVAGFEVWVTHQVNLSALLGNSVQPGEALLLKHDAAAGAPVLLATLQLG